MVWHKRATLGLTMTASTCADLAAPLLERVAEGALRERPLAIRFWDGSELPAAGEGSTPTVVLSDPRALAHVLREPNQLGLARAWVSGGLGVEGDLESVLAFGSRLDGVGLTAAERLEIARAALRLAGSGVLRRPPIPARERRLSGRRHSRGRDREAVRHHYDVPTSFYRLVLGPTMVYSCAYFSDVEDSLETAQERKLDVICRKLALRPGDRLLDIGCGWGSLILHAAQHYGVQAVGVTLSEPQANVARERALEAGVADRCDVRVADYREVADGPYDAIASVGMYEHVGRAQLDTYMDAATALLRPGGLFLNHGIVRLGPAPPDDKRFIERYVFPDGELQPIGTVVAALERAGMELRDVESLREHYAVTLRRWVDNLAAHREQAIAAAGEEVERIWRLYMTACALAFERGEISVIQALAVRPGGSHRLPLDRLTRSEAVRAHL